MLDDASQRGSGTGVAKGANHQLQLLLNFKKSSGSGSCYILKTAPDPTPAPPKITGTGTPGSSSTPQTCFAAVQTFLHAVYHRPMT